MNNNINRLHERALRIIYLDDISTFEELLKKDNSVKIHTQNSQILAAEMFKVKKGIATSLLEEVFQIAYLNYNLENKREFKSCNVKTVFFFGTESLAFLCLKILDNSFQFTRDEFK